MLTELALTLTLSLTLILTHTHTRSHSHTLSLTHTRTPTLTLALLWARTKPLPATDDLIVIYLDSYDQLRRSEEDARRS